MSDGDTRFESIVNRHGREFRTVGDMVRSVLRESILSGVFAPGEYLRQDRLAEALGVSRIPVRSALLQLESEGLITFNTFRGAVVNGLSADEMREVYEIREVLESHALRKGFATMTPERLERLEALAQELNEVADGEAFLDRRTAFYRELYDAERDPRLVGLIGRLRSEAGRYWIQRRVAFVQRPGERDHQKLLEFVRAGDVEGAQAWQREHLRRVCAELVALMEADERPG